MSERRYIVWINNIKKLDFDIFYKEFLNIDPGEDKFEELYSDGSKKGKTKLKSHIKEEFKSALDDGFYMSDNYFHHRRFAWALVTYIGTIGIPVKVGSIAGADPQVIILEGKDRRVKKYLKDPNLDLEERFSYMKDWAEECGLIPKGEK